MTALPRSRPAPHHARAPTRTQPTTLYYTSASCGIHAPVWPSPPPLHVASRHLDLAHRFLQPRGGSTVIGTQAKGSGLQPSDEILALLAWRRRHRPRHAHGTPAAGRAAARRRASLRPRTLPVYLHRRTLERWAAHADVWDVSRRAGPGSPHACNAPVVCARPPLGTGGRYVSVRATRRRFAWASGAGHPRPVPFLHTVPVLSACPSAHQFPRIYAPPWLALAPGYKTAPSPAHRNRPPSPILLLRPSFQSFGFWCTLSPLLRACVSCWEKRVVVDGDTPHASNAAAVHAPPPLHFVGGPLPFPRPPARAVLPTHTPARPDSFHCLLLSPTLLFLSLPVGPFPVVHALPSFSPPPLSHPRHPQQRPPALSSSPHTTLSLGPHLLLPSFPTRQASEPFFFPPGWGEGNRWPRAAMQQHNSQDGGGSQYGAAAPPDMGLFSPPAAASGPVPLSSRPPSTTQPPPPPQQQQQPRASYEELAAVSGAGGFDDDMLGGGGGGGSSGASSNRWPREETQALIRIRSEMDATFRDATLKGPLWEDVSRSPVSGMILPLQKAANASASLPALHSSSSSFQFSPSACHFPPETLMVLCHCLADLGYTRSAKKCKEKFENVHKYYKRTKEGRAGRQDGKSYRFFDELEALHAAAPQPAPQLTPQPPQQLPPASTAPQLLAFAAPTSSTTPPPMSSSMPPPGLMHPAPISSAAPAPVLAPAPPMELPLAAGQQPLNLQGMSFSSMSDSESSDGESEDDDDMTAETVGSQDRLGKRKRGGGGGSKKMMSFFEGLMQQVVERQEEIQRRFLETMERREAERTAREEAWRRQEVARLNREQEQLAQERAAAASRDAAIISFLHRIGGPPPPSTATTVVVPMPLQTTPPPQKHAPPRQQQQQHPPPPPSPQQATTPKSKPISSATPVVQQQPKETSGASQELVPVTEQHHLDSGLGGGESGAAASSSRWPKTEVHALIQLRMDLDMRYNETGPKGPLWEDISSGMRRLGYNRSSKRCKEKWENINKYYKKVKESNKKRPEDSKTCPYFHQLEAIYSRKNLRAAAAASNNVAIVAAAPPALPEPQPNPSRQEIEGKNINDDKRNNGGSSGGAAVPSSNGDKAPTTPAAFDIDSSMKKYPAFPSGVFVLDRRRLTGLQPPREITTDETDSDDMGDEYTDDGDEGEDDVPEADERGWRQQLTSTAGDDDDGRTCGGDLRSDEHLPRHGSIGWRAIAGTSINRT
ncbi:hypothetical protein HU200_032694 [Digitaria exilis]|uniref:Myb-like domain-containing protein n=1 Tax=Digitaria exilis TaxID=1010633 RepID=A0A835BYR9_9POAL|nr:hypothetical protein HU200_032694 [Digitaria exilis]